jgi:hypothetical protein
MAEKRVHRRGIAWAPRARDVMEARRWVRAGLPINSRWLPFLPPSLRLKARIQDHGVVK